MIATAERNLEALRKNSYPGRGIVVGLDDLGKYLVQCCWIMGREENSRNRVYTPDETGGRIFTEAADSAKMKDPTNIIYNAMMEFGISYVVSNGYQTDAVMEATRHSTSFCFCDEMHRHSYELDSPYTPRITALATLNRGRVHLKMAVLKKSPWDSACDRSYYDYDTLKNGVGFSITTYARDGNPPPPFQGEPYLLPLPGSIANTGETVWNALNPENRVSLAVKWIDLSTRQRLMWIMNRFKKVKR